MKICSVTASKLELRMDLLKDHIELRILFEILPENGLAMSDCHIWFQLSIRVVRCWSRGFEGSMVKMGRTPREGILV